MSTAIDRVVVPQPGGGWEVRSPDAGRGTLHASSRSQALQWAWNITRSTGGQVVVHRRDGSLEQPFAAQGPFEGPGS